jgi:calcineurin-like phosphoesterase family protein
MSTFFFSDPHFHHESMAKKRGFSCAEDMNELIVKNWNKTISKRDCVFLLGDITMEKNHYQILARLQGLIHVVLGNHDQRQHVQEMLKYVHSVSGIIDYKRKAILTHCPVHPSQLEFRYPYNIHGHVHENSIDDPRYINVCAEMIKYTPVEFKKLIDL